MKRVVKKTTLLENSGTKTPKTASAKISKTEKPAALQKKTVVPATLQKKPVVTPEKPAKKLKPNASAAKIAVPAPKAKKAVSIQAAKQESPVPVKKKSAVAAEKIAAKSKSVTAAKVSVSTPEKPVAANQPTRQKKQKKEKIVSPVPVKNSKADKEKVLPKTINQKVKAADKKAEIVIPAIKAKSGNKAKVAKQKVEKKIEKKTEKKIEIVIPPMKPKPVKKKIKPIGSAVVRGKNGRYDFEIFPLDAEIKDGSAIYVISKRITDKGGRGHHKFVCIGQTESLLGEIKKHKKDKCIKHYKANVICLLREDSETNRVKIETDLREAHTIFCNQK
ncbi:MAG TPA: hypothetical protein VNB22_10475 [Pyrinomonadaceae bacterium]|nr:hypothetical protein [Pyrinomonadaceae bacterium]